MMPRSIAQRHISRTAAKVRLAVTGAPRSLIASSREWMSALVIVDKPPPAPCRDDVLFEQTLGFLPTAVFGPGVSFDEFSDDVFDQIAGAPRRRRHGFLDGLALDFFDAGINAPRQEHKRLTRQLAGLVEPDGGGADRQVARLAAESETQIEGLGAVRPDGHIKVVAGGLFVWPVAWLQPLDRLRCQLAHFRPDVTL